MDAGLVPDVADLAADPEHQPPEHNPGFGFYGLESRVLGLLIMILGLWFMVVVMVYGLWFMVYGVGKRGFG